ncbi:MAG: hypothetical protein GX616_20200 [Planctomycetes bacterium]|nr:hypothetical protein [Planctomycetota bacterium]
MRNALLCLGASVALMVLSAPLARTFFLQIDLIIRRGVNPAAKQAFTREVRRSTEIMGLQRTCQVLTSPKTQPDDQAILVGLRSNNGLRAWAELLLLTRRADGAIASRPVDDDSSILAAIATARSAPPIRLYTAEVRSLVEKTFAEEPPRILAAHASSYVDAVCLSGSRPVLMELVRRLEALADRWDEAGKHAEARAAREAILDLMTDATRDARTPELAMLASEMMLPAATKLNMAERAERLGEFRDRWRQAFQGDRINWIPHTGQTVLAEKAHDRLMRSMTATLVAMATWVILAAIAIFMMVAILVTQPPDDITVQWRRLKRGPREAAVLACSPMLGFLVLIALADIPWTWLISYPTLKAGLLLPGLLLVSIGAATWISVQLREPFKPCPLPGKVAWAAAAFCVPTLLVLAMFVSPNREPWQPPALIQRLRLWGAVVGGVCLALAALWVIGGVVHRARTGLPAGVWARASLGTVASALLLTSFVLWGVLAVNQYCDIRHERAFVKAMADPVADKLGPDWLERYFLQPLAEQVPTTRTAG